MTVTINTYGELWKSGSKVTDAMRKAARSTQAYAKFLLQNKTPIRTGRLRAGWQVSPVANGLRIQNPVPYGIYVEMGTRRMRARPMVAPSMPRIQQHFREELGRLAGQSLGAKVSVNSGDAFAASNPRDTLVYQMLTQGSKLRTDTPKRSVPPPKPKGFNR